MPTQSNQPSPRSVRGFFCGSALSHGIDAVSDGLFLLGVVPPLLQEGDVFTAVVEGCGQQLLQALFHLRWFKQSEQFNATAADPLRAGLLGLISRAPVLALWI